MPMRPFYVRCASCAPEQEEARAAVTPDVLHVLRRVWATMAELQVGSPMWPMCSGAGGARAAVTPEHPRVGSGRHVRHVAMLTWAT